MPNKSNTEDQPGKADCNSRLGACFSNQGLLSTARSWLSFVSSSVQQQQQNVLQRELSPEKCQGCILLHSARHPDF